MHLDCWSGWPESRSSGGAAVGAPPLCPGQAPVSGLGLIARFHDSYAFKIGSLETTVI